MYYHMSSPNHQEMRQIIDLHNRLMSVDGEPRPGQLRCIRRRPQHQPINLLAAPPLLQLVAERSDRIERRQVAFHGGVGILVGGWWQRGLHRRCVVGGDDDVILAAFDERIGGDKAWPLAGTGEDDEFCAIDRKEKIRMCIRLHHEHNTYARSTDCSFSLHFSMNHAFQLSIWTHPFHMHCQSYQISFFYASIHFPNSLLLPNICSFFASAAASILGPLLNFDMNLKPSTPGMGDVAHMPKTTVAISATSWDGDDFMLALISRDGAPYPLRFVGYCNILGDW